MSAARPLGCGAGPTGVLDPTCNARLPAPMHSDPQPFDRRRLQIRPLAEREHLVFVRDTLPLEAPAEPLDGRSEAALRTLGRRLQQARERGAPVLALLGAHVVRAGVARHLIDLLDRKLLTHLAFNGAGPIHDYELARIGATCESVAHYIRLGQFGLWRETGELNDVIRRGAEQGLGLGESVGRHILQQDYPFAEFSLFAACVRRGIPATVHVGIGYDILHEHPNFDPAATATASYRDFLQVCRTVSHLEGGVVLCIGSAVMGPEVYLKALSMARNVAHQEDRRIARFTTAAFDLVPLEGDFRKEPDRRDPQYYYRPWKTVLVRTVADGGESHYVCGDHRRTIPRLWHYAVNEVDPQPAANNTADT